MITFRFHKRQLLSGFTKEYEDGAVLERKYIPINSVAATVHGNNYTQMAKKLLFGEVKIDSLASPSEMAIIADKDANPAFIASDMMSQAEHGTGFEAGTTYRSITKGYEEKSKQLDMLQRV